MPIIGHRSSVVTAAVEQWEQRSGGNKMHTMYDEEKTVLEESVEEKLPFAYCSKVANTASLSDCESGPRPSLLSSKASNTRFLPQLSQVTQKYVKQGAIIFAGAFLVWIPGLVAVSAYQALSYPMFARPTVFGVGLFWWSAWLSFSWVSLWVAAAIAYIMPAILRQLSSTFASSLTQLISYVQITRKYLSVLVWTLIVWSAYLSLVWTHFPGRESVDDSLLDPLSANSTSSSNNATTSSQAVIDALYGAGTTTGTSSSSQVLSYLLDNTTNSAHLITISRFLFGLMVCSALLFADKLAVQNIANSFHTVTYSDRIKLVKYHTDVLTTLYVYAKQHGCSGLLQAEMTRSIVAPTARKRLHWDGLRNVLSNYSVPFKTIYKDDIPIPLNPNVNTPILVVEATLEDAEETLQLAKGIWKACSVEGQITEELLLPAFNSDLDATRRAFSVIDRDCNGTLDWEEVLYACMQIHRERLSLLYSMSDIDFAVEKLDKILATLWGTVSVVLLAALLSSRISTLLSSLGAILLGLSWLVASSAQEVLASLIWVFAKHPIDVDDVITVPGLISTSSASSTKDVMATLEGFVDGDTFVVEEVQLLSTVLRTRSTGKQVQVSNSLLSQKAIINLGRSGPIEEPFVLAVAFDTPFEKLEALQSDFTEWLTGQGRDFQPGLRLAIDDLRDHTQMTLVLMIRYKSNWQDNEIRLRRRNMWIATLRQLIQRHAICGPSANVIEGSSHTPQKPITRHDFSNPKVGSRFLQPAKDDFELFRGK